MHTAAPQPNLNPADPAIEQSVFFWLAVIVTGVTAGIAGGALMRLLYFVEHTAWSYNSAHVFLYAVTRASAARRICNLALAGILVGLVGALLRWLFKPGPDLETAIWFRSGQIPLVSTLTKAVLAIVSVGLGTCLGRESPIKQTGGALASAVARLGKLSPQQRQLLVACGVGAGMASAYNVPLGGGLFTVEVLIGSMSLQVVMPALACSAVATAASWLLLPISPIYTVGEFQMDWPLLVWAVLVGPLMGWAAVAVIRSIDWAQANQPRGVAAILMPMVVLTLLGVLAIAFPQLLGNGKDTVQLAFSDQFSIGLLLLLPVLKLLTTVASLRCGASGGLFTPTMTIGALLGGALGHAWSHIWPGTLHQSGSYAVTGAAAVLAAATQGPLSSLVLVLELTRRVDATMVPLLLAVIGAALAARRLESRSIYSSRASE